LAATGESHRIRAEFIPCGAAAARDSPAERMTSGSAPRNAMVLAAGLGKRMRPITDTLPKPLVSVGGRRLIDYALDRLAEAGVEHAVVNVHYLADQIEAAVARRARPRITVSDERGLLLETGGGVKRALGLLGSAPFFVFNSDSCWIEGSQPNLPAMAAAWDPARMDVLLLVAPMATSIGMEGRGDFHMASDGRLRRRAEDETAAYAYAGVAIWKQEMFADTPEGAWSLNLLFDRASARGRLLGHVLDGTWLHIGTPQALADAEAAMAASDR
jgi:MurNAc alpha-1-phosphate uridylyltransferase